MKKIIFVLIALLFSRCNILIKDDPNTGVTYTPIEFNVQSVDYIKDYNDNEINWVMKPMNDIDVSLNIICQLTDKRDIQVVDLKQNDNDIIINLTHGLKKENILKKPVIKISLKGINPYKKMDYNLIVKSDFNFIKTNINFNHLKNIVKKNHLNINYNPSDINLIKRKNKLTWSLNYPVVITGYDNPISSLELIIDDSTKKIINTIKSNNSIKISKGNPIGFISDEIFIYENNKNLYAYSIPKNESIKILQLNSSIRTAKFDYAKNNLYLLLKNESNSLVKINSNLLYENINIGNFKIFDYAVSNDKIFFVVQNKNKSEIYKLNNGVPEIFKSLDFKIQNINTNGEAIAIEVMSDKDNYINLIKADGDISYIGLGSKPIINNQNIFYIRSTNKTLYSELVSYSLSTGLSNSHLHGIITNIYLNLNDNLIVKENVEGNTKLSTLQNNILDEIIQIPREKIFYSKKYNSIIILFENTIYYTNVS